MKKGRIGTSKQGRKMKRRREEYTPVRMKGMKNDTKDNRIEYCAYEKGNNVIIWCMCK